MVGAVPRSLSVVQLERRQIRCLPREEKPCDLPAASITELESSLAEVQRLSLHGSHDTARPIESRGITA